MFKQLICPLHLWDCYSVQRGLRRSPDNMMILQVSAEMYSAPSIVLQSRGADGSLHVFDDFRESYAWLRFNTHPNAKVSNP